MRSVLIDTLAKKKNTRRYNATCEKTVRYIRRVWGKNGSIGSPFFSILRVYGF